jgi:BON domain
MKRYAVLIVVAGAALAFYLDPQNGKRRRHMTVDRVGGFFRHGGRRAGRLGRRAASGAYGATMKATHLREAEKPQLNDADLAQKVQSEVFRDPDIPKQRVNINAENGVVYLRGEVDTPDLIRQLEKATHDVQGVRAVENLLHLPGMPARPHQ